MITGIIRTAGVKTDYEVKNQRGAVISRGTLVPDKDSVVWTPFTISIPRTDNGNSDRFTLAITRTAENSYKEIYRMIAFRAMR